MSMTFLIRRLSRGWLIPLLVITSACGDSGDSDGDTSSGDSTGEDEVRSGAPQDLKFHGEQPMLPDFSFEDALTPKSGAAQLGLKLKLGGGIEVDAVAAAVDGSVRAKGKSGRLEIDTHVKLDGRLKVDTPHVKYDGNIPRLGEIDFAIAGKTEFEPFLLDGATATVDATVSELTLPDIPLGNVPGKLRLSILPKTRLKTTFAGTCLRATKGKVSYTGTTTTTGTILLRASIVLDLPKPYNEPIDVGEIPVPLPPTTRPIDLGNVGAPVKDAAKGKCGK